jgi:hypothetical protein
VAKRKKAEEERLNKLKEYAKKKAGEAVKNWPIPLGDNKAPPSVFHQKRQPIWLPFLF